MPSSCQSANSWYKRPARFLPVAAGPECFLGSTQVALRNELRASLADVDQGITRCENEIKAPDPVIEAAKAAAKERSKLPLHLRGTVVLT